MIDRCIDLWTAISVAEGCDLQNVCNRVGGMQAAVRVACDDLASHLAHIGHQHQAERAQDAANMQVRTASCALRGGLNMHLATHTL